MEPENEVKTSCKILISSIHEAFCRGSSANSLDKDILPIIDVGFARMKDEIESE